MGADQFDNADRCAELGVGIIVDPVGASPADIVTAIDAVLSNAVFSAAVAALATEAAAQVELDDHPEIQTPFATR